MLTHADVWRAIDRLAAEYGFTASGLARRAGLDATTFNKSKRFTREGKRRWPSTESVSKVLDATGASLAEFVAYTADGEGAGVYRNLHMVGLLEAGGDGLFDDSGRPAGSDWDQIPFPGFGDPHAFAIEVSGASLEPVYREGDILVASPQASIRRGDRVLIRTRYGEVTVKTLVRRTANRVDVTALNPAQGDRSIAAEDVEWLARVMWASQ